MSPKSKAAFREQRDAGRERFVRVALELFARYGFEKTSVRMIAEKANSSLGLMYNYFVSKEELLQVIFRRGMEDVAVSFDRADSGATPAEKLERLVRSSFDIVSRNRDFWRVFYSLRTQPGIAERLPEDVVSWQARIHARLEGYLKALNVPEPEVSAWLLFASIDGAAQHSMLEPDYPLDRVADKLIATYVETR